MALDYPLCHFECRFVATASPDAFGVDADRLEFRFLSAADRLDVTASTCSVPPSWLVVSRVSGPNLIKNARWCRDHYARVESPDQQLQLSQLASVHAHWTASTEAPSEDDTGPRISAASVECALDHVRVLCSGRPESMWRRKLSLCSPMTWIRRRRSRCCLQSREALQFNRWALFRRICT